MAPLNVIGQIANPFSMAFRLFGNILGGMIIMGLVYSVVPVLIPAPLHFYFDVFAGVLQTFIFIMLTMTFVTMAAD
jgi:F-type H+-transporting ATPase subunit a